MSEWLHWYCRDCGHLVIAKEEPTPLHWNDGHTCQHWVRENDNKEGQNV